MAITTTTVIGGPVDVKFQVNLLRNAKANCPYYAGTVPASIMNHQGTFTAKWRRIENLTPTTTPLTELTGAVAFPTRTGSSPTVTDTTAVVRKYGDFIYLNEEVDLINFSEQGAKISEILGIQAGRSLNRLQRDVMEDNFTAVLSGVATTASDISGAATASGFVKVGELAGVNNTLTRADAIRFRPQTTGSQNIGSTPIRTSFWGICHVDTTEHLRTLTGWNEVITYAGQTETYEGEVGHLGGVRFIESTEASIDTGSGAGATSSATTAGRSTATRFDIYNTVVYGMDAVGSLGLDGSHIKEIYQAGDRLPAIQVIAHSRGSAGSADPLNELSTAGWKTWHAGVILNTAWGRTYRHSVAVIDSAE